MKHLFGFVFASLALCVAYANAAVASPAYVYDRIVLAQDIRVSFFEPLAAAACPFHLTTADRGVVVPIPTPRPTQGADILTATECSMTTASNGMLDKAAKAGDTIAGSVGFIV